MSDVAAPAAVTPTAAVTEQDTGRATAAAVKDLIGRVGGAFMISREARGFLADADLPLMAPYFRGRFAVLGDVDPDVVVAAAGFFPAAVVRELWTAATVVPAAEAADGYARVCRAFAHRKLAGLAEPEADRLADLLERVVRHADPAGAPVFAGWRALPLPADGIGRAAQLMHALRELRGAQHLVAVLASGLTPLQAVLANGSALVPGGEANAEFFGWPRPYPEVTDGMRERRAAAERLTDDLAAPAFAVLTQAEAGELVVLLRTAESLVFG